MNWLANGRDLWRNAALLKRMDVARGERKMSIAIYDHALHVVGGGQKYAATIAACLQDRFDVTYIVNRPIEIGQLREWYGLDLSRCKVRLVPLPFYGARDWIDAALVTGEMDNPFDAVARVSADYDVFVNANMLDKVRPLSPLSIFVCHFPDVRPRAHFAAHEYTLLVTNSQYGSSWLRRRWDLETSMLLYPPIDAAAPRVEKERFILSVARFEPGGSKKQREMIEAFAALKRALPERTQGWRLILVGGSLDHNPYLERVRELARAHSDFVEVRCNVSEQELRSWYARALLFWHACGMGASEAHLIEHFGMSTAEAMQNGCVPIVFDGGGQREIVEHGLTGFRFRGADELCAWTARLISDEGLRTAVQERAQKSSGRFLRSAFEARARWLFDLILDEYSRPGTADLPKPNEELR